MSFLNINFSHLGFDFENAVTIVPLANGEFCFPPIARPPPEPDTNANPEHEVDRGRGNERGRHRRVHHGFGQSSDDNMNQDEGSPTTRFIQQYFIPSLNNETTGESSHGHNGHTTNEHFQAHCHQECDNEGANNNDQQVTATEPDPVNPRNLQVMIYTPNNYFPQGS